MVAKLVGKRIKEHRLQRGWTQAELAQKVDMSIKHVSAIECGVRMPSLDVFVLLINVLETDANSLLCDVINISNENESSVLWSKISHLQPQSQRKVLDLLDVFIKAEQK